MEFASQDHESVRYSVMIILTTNIVSFLLFIKNKLNKQKYIDEILRPILLALLIEHTGVIFHEDIA